MSYHALSLGEVAIATALILINGLVSLAFGLGLEKSLAVAALRMVVQLSLIGVVLKVLFESGSPTATAATAGLMGLAAAYEVLSRQERPISGWRATLLGGATPFLAGLVGTVFAMTLVMKPEPWYAPRFLLPVLGMIVGNALSGVSLTLNTLTETVARERTALEARLALGETRFSALAAPLGKALRTGLMPILNAMAAAGVVSLPGMMTGQILSGIDPVEATKYQLVIMFLIAGSTALAVTASALGAVLLLTDDRHRLRLDRLRAA
jgi:putative ABC transport system permease protein